MTDVDVLAFGRERVRTRPFRAADQSAKVALLAPIADAPLPSSAFVRRCVDTLAARGFDGVVTGALAPQEARPFLAAGFAEAERLHLLTHDLSRLPTPGAVPGITLSVLRGARRRLGVLPVDTAAFPPFWQLDTAALDEALHATPRVRCVEASDAATGDVLGYVITGRARRRGYVQRLAVLPSAQGRGIGTALVVDGLRWLRRWRTEHAVVNTQLDNLAALAVYERLGFRRMPHGLTVLTLGEVGRPHEGRRDGQLRDGLPPGGLPREGRPPSGIRPGTASGGR